MPPRPAASLRRPSSASILPLCFALSASLAHGADRGALVELKTAKQTFVGRCVTVDDDACRLMTRDGRLETVALDRVTGHRLLGSTFRPFSSAEIRDRLQREFGKEMDIVGTEHYLVCGRRGTTDRYARDFENAFRAFHHYFSTRGFRIERPEFPLVAIIFPNPQEFAAYCAKDGFRPPQGLVGYYVNTSNRIALFESNERAAGESPDGVERPIDLASAFEGGRAPVMPFAPQALGGPCASFEGNLRDTIVHEATHQVAFNVGLHSRLGRNPKWIVEGLATVFEAPGVRDAGNSPAPKTRINRDRFVWFGSYVQDRRGPRTVADFVASDDPFARAPLDAYAEAWALTFFLVETRSTEYAKYLKTVAARDLTQPYSPEERVADFQGAFGKDLKQLDAEWLRFVDRLQ